MIEDFAHQRRPVLLLEERHGDLAGTETRHLYVPAKLLETGIERGFDIGGGDGDGEFALQPLVTVFNDLHGVPCP